MRIDVGPGYRVYFTRWEKLVYLLLLGGNKRNQKRDIKRAKATALTIGKAGK
jgi:putative addiction module killer protein